MLSVGCGAISENDKSFSSQPNSGLPLGKERFGVKITVTIASLAAIPFHRLAFSWEGTRQWVSYYCQICLGTQDKYGTIWVDGRSKMRMGSRFSAAASGCQSDFESGDPRTHSLICLPRHE